MQLTAHTVGENDQVINLHRHAAERTLRLPLDSLGKATPVEDVATSGGAQVLEQFIEAYCARWRFA